MRRCLGAAFATMEMAEVLRVVAQRFDLAPAQARGERMRRRGITLQPGRGARVVLSDACGAYALTVLVVGIAYDARPCRRRPA